MKLIEDLKSLKKRTDNEYIKKELQSIVFKVELSQNDIALAIFSSLRHDGTFAKKDEILVNKIYSRMKKACAQEGGVNYGGLF